MLIHEIQPVYDETSKILILGSFPSVVSRANEFFYHHPQNRFWKVVAYLCQEAVPVTINDKKELLWKHHIAIWDVIHSCDIVGSSDQSIENVVVNDLTTILQETKIQRIYTNGTLATKLYHQYLEKQTKIKATALPSSSSANARYSLTKLQTVWQEKIGEI